METGVRIIKPNREEKPRLFDHGYYGDAAVVMGDFREGHGLPSAFIKKPFTSDGATACHGSLLTRKFPHD